MFCSTDSESFTPLQLFGKRVFLVLNSSKNSTRKIQDFVKSHGARVVNFLQRNVDVIIMDMTLRKPPTLPQTATRSKKLIEMSLKKHSPSSMESFASKWKIPIIDHRKVLYHCKTFLYPNKVCAKTQKRQQKKLRAPFIKMEDHSRKYRPEFVEFQSFPFIDTTVPGPNSPFDTWYEQNASKKKDFVNGKGNQQYFCELCHENYTVLESHLETLKHKQAAEDDSLFAGVDALINRGVSLNEFVQRMTEKSNLAK